MTTLTGYLFVDAGKVELLYPLGSYPRLGRLDSCTRYQNMPKCRNCTKKFPNWMTIEGKNRNLSHRKYCLECSPWRGHNTRPLVFDETGTAKTVSEVNKDTYACKCGKVYTYDRSKGNNATSCGSCAANDRRFTIKPKAITYKGGKCERCGYDKYQGALQFHHLNPEEKDFSLGGSHARSWSAIKAELDKCILVCANCHSEIHNEQILEQRELMIKKVIKQVKENGNIKPCRRLREHKLWFDS